MKLILKVGIVASIVFWAHIAVAAFLVSVSAPKTYGEKSVISIRMENKFGKAIESARAVAFLMDDQGKVVGQQTRWILTASKDKPALAAGAKSSFNFVVQSEKPFTRIKMIVTRVVLADGTLGDLNKDVTIKMEGK